jgi:heme/copper-type cytochrome/quinol oxidase subunit 1
MKVTRRLLLGILVALGVFIIAYSLFRQFTGIGFDERFEKRMFDIVMFAALGIFMYNRKLASDEKKERDAEERAKAAKQAEAAEDELDENTVNREDTP